MHGVQTFCPRQDDTDTFPQSKPSAVGWFSPNRILSGLMNLDAQRPFQSGNQAITMNRTSAALATPRITQKPRFTASLALEREVRRMDPTISPSHSSTRQLRSRTVLKWLSNGVCYFWHTMVGRILRNIAAAIVILAALWSGISYILNLMSRIHRLEDRVENFESRGSASLPSGVILPYMGRHGVASLPEGWVLCGSGGTPELEGRFLFGTNRASEVGTPLGSLGHSHRAVFATGWETGGQRSSTEAADNFAGGVNWNHQHQVEIETQPAQHLPPSVRVMFFCKE